VLRVKVTGLVSTCREITSLSQQTILWASDHHHGIDPEMLSAVAALGFRLVAAQTAQTLELNAQVRILHVSAKADADALRKAYGRDRRLTLMIAEGDEAECLALDIVDVRDEVVRGPIEAPALAARLRRLIRRDADIAKSQLDMITGLINRRAFEKMLREALRDMLAGEARGLVIIDADYFRQVNHQYGHQVGDSLLAAGASALSAGASPEDRIARIGGDEFALLLSRYDTQTLLSDAATLLRRFAAPITLPGVEVPLSLGGSAGLAFLHPHLTETKLIQQAESAMFEAKLAGRGRLLPFEFMTDTRCDAGDVDLQRFNEATQNFSERLVQMVNDMGRRLVEGARRQALQDALTGAHNRRYFDERLARELAQAQALGRSLSLAFIDIDNFHDINATYGWASGDAVLRGFATVAGKNIRLVDWLARYGGEEFCIVLPDTGPGADAEVAERVRAAVAQHRFLATDERQVPVTISVGVATLTHSTGTALELAVRAGQACLQAKASGKNRVVSLERNV